MNKNDQPLTQKAVTYPIGKFNRAIFAFRILRDIGNYDWGIAGALGEIYAEEKFGKPSFGIEKQGGSRRETGARATAAGREETAGRDSIPAVPSAKFGPVSEEHHRRKIKYTTHGSREGRCAFLSCVSNTTYTYDVRSS